MIAFLYRYILLFPQLFYRSRLVGTHDWIEDSLVELNIRAIRWIGVPKRYYMREQLIASKLNALLQSAVRLPYWSTKLANVELPIKHVRSSLSRLPVSTKKELQQCPIVERTNMKFANQYGRESITSGSTGEPLAFYLDDRLGLRLRAQLAVAVGRDHYRLADMVNLWPTRNPNTLFGNRFFAGKTREEFLAQRQDMYKQIQGDVVVMTFPSLLRVLLDAAEVDGVSLQAGLVLTSGEPLDDNLKKLASEELGCPIYNYYACRETSVVATKCVFGRFHTNEEDVLLEVVNESGQSVKDQTGRIALTALNSHLAPFIRYCNGDRGRVFSSPCPCGRVDTSFAFSGREVAEVDVVLPDGTTIQGYHFTGIFNRRFESVQQYQVRHIAPHSFQVFVVPGPNFNDQTEEDIMKELINLTAKSNVSLEVVSDIQTKSGKILPYVKTF